MADEREQPLSRGMVIAGRLRDGMYDEQWPAIDDIRFLLYELDAARMENERLQKELELWTLYDKDLEQARADIEDYQRRLKATSDAENEAKNELFAAREREKGLADDLRAQGWAVAVHNDYALNGEQFTFWLFTKGPRCVRGEGRTDADALAVVRRETGLIDFCLEEEAALGREDGGG